MQSSLKNMVIVLGTITLVASAAVGGIYLLTKEPIEAAQQKKVNDAIAQVLPEFDNRPADNVVEVEVDGKIVKIYPASKECSRVCRRILLEKEIRRIDDLDGRLSSGRDD